MSGRGYCCFLIVAVRAMTFVIRMMPRIVGPHQVFCRASEATKSDPLVRVIANIMLFIIPPGRF